MASSYAVGASRLVTTGSCGLHKMGKGISTNENTIGSSTFNFLGLPRELRNLIYEWSFRVDDIYYPDGRTSIYPIYFDRSQNFHGNPNTILGFVLVNQQVSDEYLDFVYTRYHFFLRLENDGNMAWGTWQFSTNMCQHVRHCTLQHCIDDETMGMRTASLQSIITNLVARLVNLKIFRLLLTSGTWIIRARKVRRLHEAARAACVANSSVSSYILLHEQLAIGSPDFEISGEEYSRGEGEELKLQNQGYPICADTPFYEQERFNGMKIIDQEFPWRMKFSTIERWVPK